MMVLSLWLVLATATPQSTEEDAVSLAIEALAHDVGMSEDSIELSRATAVEWPDGSLGCPKEGEVYVQVVTPGYLVTLQADGQVFAVHVGNDRAVICGNALRRREGARVEEAIAPPAAPKLRELVAEARKDLAKRLSVEPESLDLLEISEVVWPDASLGCPQPGKAYPQVTREGFLIRLRFGKRVYRYHSGESGVPFFCGSLAAR